MKVKITMKQRGDCQPGGGERWRDGEEWMGEREKMQERDW